MTYEEARAALGERCPEPGTLWRHRNGTLYTVVCGCIIEATLTPCVCYREHRSAWPCWVRPLDEFLDGRFTRDE